MTTELEFQKLTNTERDEIRRIFGDVLGQEVLGTFDTYTYGFSRTNGIQFVRQSMFGDEKYDEETLDSIAALMEKENQGKY